MTKVVKIGEPACQRPMCQVEPEKLSYATRAARIMCKSYRAVGCSNRALYEVGGRYYCRYHIPPQTDEAEVVPSKRLQIAQDMVEKAKVRKPTSFWLSLIYEFEQAGYQVVKISETAEYQEA